MATRSKYIRKVHRIGLCLLILLTAGSPMLTMADDANYATLADSTADDFLVYLNKHGKRVFTDKPITAEGYTLIYPRAGDERRWKPLTDSMKRRYDADIAYAARSYNVSEALIKAVIHAESHFDPTAVSRAGAQGLMQLMPKTALAMDVHDVFDARQNILGGTRYLRYLMEQFDNDLRLILAAYNAGEGNVRRYNGIPPFEETQTYVKKVLELVKVYSAKP